MKERSPVFFPEFNGRENVDQARDLDWKHIRPGIHLKIGKPSNRYFQYVYPSLNFKKHSLKNLVELLDFQGLDVVVVSIVKMKNGESFMALDRKEEKKFSEHISRIYAEVKKSFQAKELII